MLSESTPLLRRHNTEPRPWIPAGSFLSILACIIIFAEGYDYGVLNGVIVRIADEYAFSIVELSLIVSSTPVGFACGTLICGPLVDQIGRVGVLQLVCAMLVVGPLSMACATTFAALFVARFFCGMGMGGAILVVSMYIAELTPAKNRGSLLCLENLCLDLGVVFGFLANVGLRGIENDWRWMLALGSTVPLVMLGVVSLGALPESPRWLLQRGKVYEAMQVLDEYLPDEQRPELTKEDHNFAGWAQVLWPATRYRNQVFTGMAVLIAQAATGVVAVTYYSSMLLTRQDGMLEQTAFLFTFWIGVARILVDVLVCFVVDRWGRKFLLLSSSIFLSISFLGLGVVHIVQFGPWCRAACLGLTLAAFSLGWGPIAPLYASEVFPTQLRGKAMALGLMVSRLCIFLTTFLFPLMLQAFGARGTSALFMVVNLVCALFVMTRVVETKSQTLESIKF